MRRFRFEKTVLTAFTILALIASRALAAEDLRGTVKSVDRVNSRMVVHLDSAGTFVTTLGVLATAHIAYEAYMPVMLAVMKIPGCLVALYLVARLRNQRMDALGNMPDEPGYDPAAAPLVDHVGEPGNQPTTKREQGVESELEMALEKMEHLDDNGAAIRSTHVSVFTGKLMLEKFLLYCRAGGPAAGHPVGQLHAATGGLAGPHVLVQRHGRHPCLHGDRQGRHSGFSTGVISRFRTCVQDRLQ